MKIGRETRAVVTGGGSGLGRALARALVARGAQVVVSDLRRDAAEETVADIAAAGGVAHALVCDVVRAGDVELLAAESARLLGPTDLIVNNAGIGAGGAIGAVSLDDWRRAIDVNLWGVVHGCHFFVPGMRERRRGHVLNVASAAAFGAMPGMAPYNATKAAVLAISETLAAEAAADGVGVTVLCPGFFRTNILAGSIGALSEGQRRLIETEMTRSKYDADDIARLALTAVERGTLHAVPHAQMRWLWRAKRFAPGMVTRLAARMDRRGQFGR